MRTHAYPSIYINTLFPHSRVFVRKSDTIDHFTSEKLRHPIFLWPAMLNPIRLIKMVRKWKKVAALGRRRITSERAENRDGEAGPPWSAMVASKGHVFVYTADGKRFMVPLKYLSSGVFRELLQRSEEEFGLPADGPITLPCGAACMESVISFLHSRGTSNAERAILESISSDGGRCTTAAAGKGGVSRQLILYGF
ncbi:auxin-responsive protein SAUR66-like [Curcuma longa]|uniref:auxin-responsive protein SAUR66-like n=1 Tax=Curcuma longa TaxID=136217 RepID=UPI003D9DCC31